MCCRYVQFRATICNRRVISIEMAITRGATIFTTNVLLNINIQSVDVRDDISLIFYNIRSISLFKRNILK